ncbi:MAG: hypothetical protein JXR70_01625 [Spirochaetales bacterium]|nr:hypothetical protein [Spirochaetales bacterium]
MGLFVFFYQFRLELGALPAAWGWAGRALQGCQSFSREIIARKGFSEWFLKKPFAALPIPNAD